MYVKYIYVCLLCVDLRGDREGWVRLCFSTTTKKKKNIMYTNNNDWCITSSTSIGCSFSLFVFRGEKFFVLLGALWIISSHSMFDWWFSFLVVRAFYVLCYACVFLRACMASIDTAAAFVVVVILLKTI